MNKHIIKNIPECSTVTELNKKWLYSKRGKKQIIYCNMAFILKQH